MRAAFMGLVIGIVLYTAYRVAVDYSRQRYDRYKRSRVRTHGYLGR